MVFCKRSTIRDFRIKLDSLMEQDENEVDNQEAGDDADPTPKAKRVRV